jgi:hypothetical protein
MVFSIIPGSAGSDFYWFPSVLQLTVKFLVTPLAVPETAHVMDRAVRIEPDPPAVAVNVMDVEVPPLATVTLPLYPGCDVDVTEYVHCAGRAHARLAEAVSSPLLNTGPPSGVNTDPMVPDEPAKESMIPLKE